MSDTRYIGLMSLMSLMSSMSLMSDAHNPLTALEIVAKLLYSPVCWLAVNGHCGHQTPPYPQPLEGNEL